MMESYSSSKVLCQGDHLRVAALLAMILFTLIAVPSTVGHAAPKTTLNIVARNIYGDLPEPILKRFSELNPDVNFDVIWGTSSDIDTKLTTVLAAGLPLDVVFSLSLRGWVSYAAQGLFLDLGSYIKADRRELERKGIPAFALDSIKVDGVTSYIPYSIWASWGTLYNATYFDQAGVIRPAARWDDKQWTWSEMVKAAKKLVIANPDGIISRPGLQLALNDLSLQGLSLAWGGDLYPEETYMTGMVNKVTFDTPTNRRALSHLVDLATIHRVSNPQIYGRSIGNGSAAMAFIEGGRLDPATYSKDYTWGMAPYPRPDEIDGRVAMPAWIRAAAILNRSSQPDVAWKFLKFLLVEAYDMGEFMHDGQNHSWNLHRGVNPNTWRQYVSTIMKGLDLAHSQSEIVSFLTQGVGSYTRIASSNALVGGGETIHGTGTPLGMYMLQASQGRMSLEEALVRAEQDAKHVLENIHRNM
jgi:ABC-type glycerol-3-phosphate transport system substrate-binding protein